MFHRFGTGRGRRSQRGGPPRGRGRGGASRGRGRGGAPPPVPASSPPSSGSRARAPRGRRRRGGRLPSPMSFAPASRFIPICQLALRGFDVPADGLVLEVVVKETLDKNPTFGKFLIGDRSSTHLQIIHRKESLWVWRSGPLRDHEDAHLVASDLSTAYEDGSLSVAWDSGVDDTTGHYRSATICFGRREVRLTLRSVSDAMCEFFLRERACRERAHFLHQSYASIRPEFVEGIPQPERPTSKPYKVVICGQMKCGKSELVNMLLGHLPVCVSGGSSCTSTIWSVKYGENPCYILYPSRSHPEVCSLPRAEGHDWTEVHNAMKNLSTRFRAEGQDSLFTRGYRPKVDVELPLEILKFITIIDTPGRSEIFATPAIGEAIENETNRVLLNADLVICVSTSEKSNAFTAADQQFLVDLRKQVEETDPTIMGSLARKFLFVANRFDLKEASQINEDYGNVTADWAVPVGQKKVEEEENGYDYYGEEGGEEEDDGYGQYGQYGDYGYGGYEGGGSSGPSAASASSYSTSVGERAEARELNRMDIVDHLQSTLTGDVFFGEGTIDPRDILVVSSLKATCETDPFYSQLADQFRRRVFQKLLDLVYVEPMSDCLSQLSHSMGTSFEVSYSNLAKKGWCSERLKQLQDDHTEEMKVVSRLMEDIVPKLRLELQKIFAQGQDIVQKVATADFVAKGLDVEGIGVERSNSVKDLFLHLILVVIKNRAKKACRRVISSVVEEEEKKQDEEYRARFGISEQEEFEEEGEGVTGPNSVAIGWMDSVNLTETKNGFSRDAAKERRAHRFITWTIPVSIPVLIIAGGLFEGIRRRMMTKSNFSTIRIVFTAPQETSELTVKGDISLLYVEDPDNWNVASLSATGIVFSTPIPAGKSVELVFCCTGEGLTAIDLCGTGTVRLNRVMPNDRSRRQRGLRPGDLVTVNNRKNGHVVEESLGTPGFKKFARLLFGSRSSESDNLHCLEAWFACMNDQEEILETLISVVQSHLQNSLVDRRVETLQKHVVTWTQGTLKDAQSHELLRCEAFARDLRHSLVQPRVITTGLVDHCNRRLCKIGTGSGGLLVENRLLTQPDDSVLLRFLHHVTYVPEEVTSILSSSSQRRVPCGSLVRCPSCSLRGDGSTYQWCYYSSRDELECRLVEKNGMVMTETCERLALCDQFLESVTKLEDLELLDWFHADLDELYLSSRHTLMVGGLGDCLPEECRSVLMEGERYGWTRPLLDVIVVLMALYRGCSALSDIVVSEYCEGNRLVIPVEAIPRQQSLFCPIPGEDLLSRLRESLHPVGGLSKVQQIKDEFESLKKELRSVTPYTISMGWEETFDCGLGKLSSVGVLRLVLAAARKVIQLRGDRSYQSFDEAMRIDLRLLGGLPPTTDDPVVLEPYRQVLPTSVHVTNHRLYCDPLFFLNEDADGMDCKCDVYVLGMLLTSLWLAPVEVESEGRHVVPQHFVDEAFYSCLVQDDWTRSLSSGVRGRQTSLNVSDELLASRRDSVDADFVVKLKSLICSCCGVDSFLHRPSFADLEKELLELIGMAEQSQ